MSTYNCNRTNETDINCYPNLTKNHECFICSSETDLNCIDLHHKPVTSVCINNDQQQEKSSACFTHIDTNGTVTRGCLFDEQKFKNDCKDGQICTICESDNCNNRSIETNTCYKCNSENDLNCRDNLNNSMSATCALSIENSGCYRSDDGGMYKRNYCFSNLF